MNDSPLCHIEKCGLKRIDAYGFCAIHKVHFVVCTHQWGYINALPVKQEIRRRMLSRDCSVTEMAETIGTPVRRLWRLLNHRTVWLRPDIADFWITRLQIERYDLEAVA